MKQKVRNYFYTLFCISFIFIITPTVAQVTIGSDKTPKVGALLDLKETDLIGANATKGIMLPRVKLKNLKPATSSELAASIGNAGNWEQDVHIGLTVYNTESDECAFDLISKGVYVYDGKEWTSLNDNNDSQQRETASNSDRSDWKYAWGTNVILHEEKVDGTNTVYKEFYSADFGNAGRWMTTNLVAFLYDTDQSQNIYHTGGRTLSGPDGNSATARDGAFWAYPKLRGTITAGESPSAQFLANHHIGLLYSWDAATAGKGGATGSLNMDNPVAGNPARNESGMPEWNGVGTQPANTQKRRQGICPKGWHLPSDYEWTQLEQEIIKNTSRYADVDDINNTDPTDGGKVQQPTPGVNGTTGFRGTHGSAMKSVCALPDATAVTNGKGHTWRKQSFALLLSGSANGGMVTANYGSSAYLWTSSGNDATRAWFRRFDATDSGVNRSIYAYAQLLSVRCKKDDN